MPEAIIMCGGPFPRASDPATLRLDVDAPLGSPERVNLNIGQIARPMAVDIPDRLIDLLEIAAYVYAADQFVSRGGRSMARKGRHWRREFRFFVPVRDPDFWRTRVTRDLLSSTLGFLSDDGYAFKFRAALKSKPLPAYLDFDGDGPPSGFKPDRVALFSGGLDSLAGAAWALSRGESLALVSHQSAPMIQSRQAELIEGLRRTLPPKRIFHVGITVNKGQEEAKEFTQRTRSFLFATLAVVIARLFGKDQITFFENGVTSVNLPIAEHILGSRATRTTHPKVLAELSQLFARVTGSHLGVTNPFLWLTKAEVVRKLGETGHAALISKSFSCSRIRLGTQSGKHCGVCSQCIDRRFAILATGLETQDPPGGYRVDLLVGSRKPGIEVTLAEAFVASALRFAGMTETAFYSHYGTAFRALPHLEGGLAENSHRLFELHRRHGNAVREVVDSAYAERTALDASLRLPSTCLLSLLKAPWGTPAPIQDLAEIEAPIPEQAQTFVGPTSIYRPIVLHVDHDSKRAVVGDQVVLAGANFRLIAELLRQFLRDGAERKPPDDFSFTATGRLADALGISEEAVRRQVLRTRDRLAEELLAKCDVAIDDSDVIESRRPDGYRLNPYLAFAPAVPKHPGDAPGHAAREDVTIDPNEA